MRRAPFTEMGLYMTFIEATGLIDTYHQLTSTLALSGNDFWIRAGFDDWDPSMTFAADAPFFFSVAASRSGVTVDEVAERVSPWLRSA